MDINLIKTYLAIIETGSFVGAANHIHITQSTVSSRIKNLEEQIGQTLFIRSKSGATPTAAGEQFHKHAVALLRVWQHARLDLSLAEEHTLHLTIGGQVSLWESLLLPWLSWSRKTYPEIALTASMGYSTNLMDRLIEGTLDLAVMYRPNQRPGLTIEHLYDEELILVTSEKNDEVKPGQNYIFVNWGPEFQADHAMAYKNIKRPALNLDLGSIAMNYILENPSSGYFPARLCNAFIKNNELKQIKPAPRFVYPVYLVYSENIEDETYKNIILGLKKIVNSL